MNVLLVVMLLGGYSGSSPAVSMQPVDTMKECEFAAWQLREKLAQSRKFDGRDSFIIECIGNRP